MASPVLGAESAGARRGGDGGPRTAREGVRETVGAARGRRRAGRCCGDRGGGGRTGFGGLGVAPFEVEALEAGEQVFDRVCRARDRCAADSASLRDRDRNGPQAG